MMTPEEKSAKQNERNKARRAADPEGEKEKARAYRAAHADQMRANSRRYYERHKESEKARRTEYNRRRRASGLPPWEPLPKKGAERDTPAGMMQENGAEN